MHMGPEAVAGPQPLATSTWPTPNPVLSTIAIPVCSVGASGLLLWSTPLGEWASLAPLLLGPVVGNGALGLYRDQRPGQIAIWTAVSVGAVLMLLALIAFLLMVAVVIVYADAGGGLGDGAD